MANQKRVFIEMSDAVRLAVDLYLPDQPAPVILEALPYRKDDITSSYIPEYRRLRDEGGYAVARVDVRGTGSSEGLATDEYPRSEQRDLCEVIAWLAEQDFCTGNVGMYGTSYSGFNSIQVAMERPEALKAIVAIYATDDEIVWPEGTATTEVRSLLRSSPVAYMLELDLEVAHDGALIGRRRWERTFDRRLQ